MDSEAMRPPDTGPSERLPWWPIPAGFLAYFLLFYYFANSGQTIPAMIFGFIGLPVFIVASLCATAVLVRLVFGKYRSRISWPGLLAWLAVATTCVVMAALVLR
ncbi:MAG: hypothetical protein EOP92_11785 [Lysobacteraceae bacterium]|nr:MAG: hypothetical protein EOP92_11785 [Xanthomonadaceae bacterium]